MNLRFEISYLTSSEGKARGGLCRLAQYRSRWRLRNCPKKRMNRTSIIVVVGRGWLQWVIQHYVDEVDKVLDFSFVPFVRQHGVIAFQKKGNARHATRERGGTCRFWGFWGFDCQNLNGWRCVEGWSRFEFSDNALERHYGVQTLFVESMIFFIGLQRFCKGTIGAFLWPELAARSFRTLPRFCWSSGWLPTVAAVG